MVGSMRTELRTNALIKFDLRDLPPDAQVRSAVLEFYAERSDPGGVISVNHVGDDSWSFLRTDPASLYNWPIENQADVPHDPNISLARQWQIAPVSTEAYSGHKSLFLYLDGGSDDGTIWIERAIPAPPQSDLTADLRFACGKEFDYATTPVYYLGLSDPEVEADFATLPLRNGWQVYNASVPISTGDRTQLWVAVGLAVSWEIQVYHYLDDVEVTLR